MKALYAGPSLVRRASLVRFPPSWLWPKPVHKPHPPILLGGAGRTGHVSATRYRVLLMMDADLYAWRPRSCSGSVSSAVPEAAGLQESW